MQPNPFPLAAQEKRLRRHGGVLRGSEGEGITGTGAQEETRKKTRGLEAGQNQSMMYSIHVVSLYILFASTDNICTATLQH